MFFIDLFKLHRMVKIMSDIYAERNCDVTKKFNSK